MPVRIPVAPDPENQERARRFFGLYELQTILGPSPDPSYLGTKKPRHCRFCDQSSPEVTFKKVAHAIPDFLGNRNVFSYFECDRCNAIFARYEDSFANFLGASRTFHQLRGKGNKVPKFKDKKNGLEVVMGEAALEMKSFEDHDPFTVDYAKRTLELVTERPGYVPLHVVKLLIKIGLTLLEPEEVAAYATASRFLLSETSDWRFLHNRMLSIYGYAMPGPPIFRAPYAQLYTLKNTVETPAFDKQLVLFFANYCFQLALPFGEVDKRLHGLTITNPRFPLATNQDRLDKYGPAQVLTLDLTSAEKKKGETHTLSFSFDEARKVPVLPSQEDFGA